MLEDPEGRRDLRPARDLEPPAPARSATGRARCMAAADELKIVVKGRQTHGAMPWRGVDPIVVGVADRARRCRRSSARQHRHHARAGGRDGRARSRAACAATSSPTRVELAGHDPHLRRGRCATDIHERDRAAPRPMIARAHGATADGDDRERQRRHVSTIRRSPRGCCRRSARRRGRASWRCRQGDAAPRTSRSTRRGAGHVLLPGRHAAQATGWTPSPPTTRRASTSTSRRC